MNYYTKYKDLLEKWRAEYANANNGKKLSNSSFAEILRMSREHFQRIIKEDSHIDIDLYEDLLARYLVWHFVTLLGFDPVDGLNATGLEDLMEQIDDKILAAKDGGKEKSGPTKVPDPLLTQIRQHAEAILASCDEASQAPGDVFQPGTDVNLPTVQKANFSDRKKSKGKLKGT